MNSLFDVSGKVVLVTGGSRGIGEMIARGFVDAGAKVYISSRKAEVGEALAKELSKIGSCTSLPADLSSEAECQRLAGEIAARETHLDVLVNNAGATWGAPMNQYDEAAFERVLALNVKGVFHLTKFLRPLLEADATSDSPSRVINIGSIDGLHVPTLETYAYSASKAAVHQLTRHLAKVLAPKVTVNAIAPGPFESKMMRATLEAFGDSIAQEAPMKRIGRPSDMAGAAIFLASPAASYITGVVLPVDGGIATLA
jgi:NAD(P)-dependent dehydrogenase (short-subunit alcohol dehydrogenase family)